jgi:hypothetical protein
MLADAERCPVCGAPVPSSLTYVEKLLRALRSPDGTTVIRAAHIFGDCVTLARSMRSQISHGMGTRTRPRKPSVPSAASARPMQCGP